ncbi:hypothetical protein CR513_58565, partial [Mucuna pruriens]
MFIPHPFKPTLNHVHLIFKQYWKSRIKTAAISYTWEKIQQLYSFPLFSMVPIILRGRLRCEEPLASHCTNYSVVDSAADVWKDLKKIFSQGDRVCIAELQQELWEELKNYRPTQNCTCTIKSSCKASRDLKKYKQEDYVISIVRSQVLLMDPLPPLNHVFSMVIQHERQNGLVPTEDLQAMVNTADGRILEKENPILMQNNVLTVVGVTTPLIFAIKSMGSRLVTKRDALFGLLQKMNLHNSSIEVPPMLYPFKFSFLDSGFRSHGSRLSIRMFHSYGKINPKTVKLPNDISVKSSIASTVRGINDLVLLEVLYFASISIQFTFYFQNDEERSISPQFRFNLLSISKLMKGGQYRALFSDKILHRRRLVWLKLEDMCQSLHYGIFPFGHVSSDKLLSLCKNFPSINVNRDIVCDICHYTRQKHLPYKTSTNRVDAIFYLLHMDMILHQSSCVETPQQNGWVERINQHLLNVMRPLMMQSGLPKNLWSYVALHTVFLINRLPSKLCNDCSPYQLLHGNLLDIDNMRVSGFLCCVHLDITQLMMFTTSKLCSHGHVTFHEFIFPCFEQSTTNNWECRITNDISLLDDPPSVSPSEPHAHEPPNQTVPNLATPHSISTTRHSTRIHKPPSHLQQYYCNLSGTSPTKSTTPYPLHLYMTYGHLSPSQDLCLIHLFHH